MNEEECLEEANVIFSENVSLQTFTYPPRRAGTARQKEGCNVCGDGVQEVARAMYGACFAAGNEGYVTDRGLHFQRVFCVETCNTRSSIGNMKSVKFSSIQYIIRD